MAQTAQQLRHPAADARDPRGAAPGPRRAAYLAALGGMFLLALGLRLLHLWQMSDELIYQVLISDARQYDAWAQEVSGGAWLGKEVFYQTPLYPYLLAFLYTALGHSLWAVRIGQALFGAVSCVFLARAGARFLSPGVGLAAGVLLAIYPPAIFFDGILQKASVDLLFMTGLLWLVAATQERPAWWRVFLVGTLVGLMTINRENAAVLVPVLLAWAAWLSWPQRYVATLAYGAMLVLGAAAVLVPVGARNYYVGGMFALTTSQMGPNFYIGNHAGATGTYATLRAGRGDPRFEAQDARELAEQATGRKLAPGEVSTYWLRKALDDIRNDPTRWLRLVGWKTLLTFHARELIDSESMYCHARYSIVLALLTPVWNFGTLAALAAAGMLWTRGERSRLWILYAIILAMAAAVALFYVFARYRYPLVPALVLFAAAGVAGGWERARRLESFPAWETLLGVVMAVVVLLACNVEVPRALDDDAITFLNAGNEMAAARRLNEAEALWRAALAEEPNLPEAYLSLGRLAIALGDWQAAREFSEQGRAIDPSQPLFPVHLAMIAAQTGDEAQAMELINEVIGQQPLVVASLPVLAKQALARGQFAAAIVLFRAIARTGPPAADEHVSLSGALRAAGRLRESLDELRAALRIDPGMLTVANNLAWVLATSPDDAVRNGFEAVTLAEDVCGRTGYKAPELLDTLAVAYAETGQFDKAVATCEQAIALAADPQMKAALGERLALYREKRAYRDPASAAVPAPR